MMGALACVQFLSESPYNEFQRKDLVGDLTNVFSQMYCKQTGTQLDCGLFELIKVGTISIPAFTKLQ